MVIGGGGEGGEGSVCVTLFTCGYLPKDNIVVLNRYRDTVIDR